jgi:glycosyltransferase involved in cell wall biosynthesis
MTAPLREPLWKPWLRAAYRLAAGGRALLGARPGGGAPRVHYGGARAGHGGGPRVKVKKLTEVFPDHPFGFNLLYVLSNAPYLPPFVLERLKARGVPVVVNQNGIFYPAWYGGDWQAENERMAVPYRPADRVLFQSEFCRLAAERFLGPRPGPGEILYNAVDTARFVPRVAPRAADGSFRILVAGKVQAHQAYRLETTLAGVAAARALGLPATLTVAGAVAPEAAAAAARLAERMEIAAFVDLRGPYTQGEAPALFASHDAYVMTNHNDACPSTVIEAMACGLPVVYAASGGVPELVGEAAGVALATGESWDEPLMPTAEQVADGLLAVAGRHAALSAAARARAVERFDIRPWIERHRRLFAELLEGQHG